MSSTELVPTFFLFLYLTSLPIFLTIYLSIYLYLCIYLCILLCIRLLSAHKVLRLYISFEFENYSIL